MATTGSSSVTIDRAYFETLVRRQVFIMVAFCSEVDEALVGCCITDLANPLRFLQG